MSLSDSNELGNRVKVCIRPTKSVPRVAAQAVFLLKRR
jgi:hypothetical protein